MKITRVHAREILDSRGKPTVEAEVHLEGGIVGRASVPSGASTGTAEACELRDTSDPWYDGFGVRQAVRNIREIIAPALEGEEFPGIASINRIDRLPNHDDVYVEHSGPPGIDARLLKIDGTANKSRLGANAILAVSLASMRAFTRLVEIPLYKSISYEMHTVRLAGYFEGLYAEPQMPLPMVNMISGGKHAGGNLDFQDVLIIPVGARDYPTQLEWIVRIYWRLGKLLTEAGYEGRLVGDEGGHGPRLNSNREAVEFVMRAIEAAKLRPGEDVTIALDVAATHFYRDRGYLLAAERGQKLTSSQMIDRLESWVNDFPITSIEDGLAENDWEGWKELTSRLGGRVKLVGDDLFATNERLMQRGIDEKVANAVLIKANQIGTLTETFRTMLLARQHGYACIVSARSGETEDDFLADLAVGTAAEYIKIGSVARSERLAKYNRLQRIAEELSQAE
ncbi:MAG TPA: phosphopyruvate hydratase [Pirellulaceae bacterium]|nr:phosphopyruvate hydratase [Pirellulaceae bacterium]